MSCNKMDFGKLSILYVISIYKVGDGASSSVNMQINDNVKHDYLVVAKWLYSSEEGLNIMEFNKHKLEEELKNHRYDIIHYVKGTNSDILIKVLQVVHKLGQHIPVLTTVCQNPDYSYLLLSPYELHHSSHFVFIDKASYNTPIISFIPQECKSQIYLISDKMEKMTRGLVYQNRNDGRIIFGRGSTLSKCPKDMFEVFDKIDCPGKEFHIVGVAKNDNWVAEEAKKRSNVVMHGFLPYNQWFEVCKTFDIFLYQLPVYCHASIDGTLGLAMSMNIPVVYYGCEAPKERFENGKNGFVAETKEDIIKYANLLASDFELRKKIGEAGRNSISKKIGTSETRIQKYIIAYQRCIETPNKSFKVPIRYYWLYLKRAWKRVLREITGIYPRPQI